MQSVAWKDRGQFAGLSPREREEPPPLATTPTLRENPGKIPKWDTLGSLNVELERGSGIYDTETATDGTGTGTGGIDTGTDCSQKMGLNGKTETVLWDHQGHKGHLSLQGLQGHRSPGLSGQPEPAGSSGPPGPPSRATRA